jgi:hypothetical protein
MLILGHSDFSHRLIEIESSATFLSLTANSKLKSLAFPIHLRKKDEIVDGVYLMLLLVAR